MREEEEDGEEEEEDGPRPGPNDYTSNCQIRFRTENEARCSKDQIKFLIRRFPLPSPPFSPAENRQTEESGLMGGVT